MKILTYYDMIEGILGSNPDARDNDLRLFYYICKNKNVDIQTATAYDVLEKMRKGELPHWETVSRCRRKVQENNPGLRGGTYNKRIAEQDNVKRELGYNEKGSTYQTKMF